MPIGRPALHHTPGQVGDITQAPALLEGHDTKAVLADKASDSNALREIIAATGAEAVIPSNRARNIIIAPDEVVYKHRIASSAASVA